MILGCQNTPVSPLPQGFVYVKDVIPQAQESVRYATPYNFLGKPVDGYLAPRAILTEKAAFALQKVAQQVSEDGYFLVIYDAYRPRTATQHFGRWAHEQDTDAQLSQWYYPRLTKEQIFAGGYIALQSSHTRGSTVDVTLIQKGSTVKNTPVPSQRSLLNHTTVFFLDDGTLDMGTSFDLFDDASHHDSPLVSEEATKNRNYLRKVMMDNGFNDYAAEWWHYTLKEEPFPETYFSFEVH